MQDKITAKLLKGLKPGTKDLFVWDTDLSGFGLKLTPKGRRSYVIQYRTGGRGSPTKRYVIDPRGVLAPDQAREKARELLVDISKGGDPAAERANGKLRTVDDLIDSFEASRTAKGRKTAAEMGKTLRRELSPAWGARAAVDIRRADVGLLLDGIVKRGHLQTANKVRRLTNTMFTWALAREYVRINPVAGIEPPAPEGERERVLTDAELVEVWNATADLSGAWTDAVRLLTLTLQRRTEVGRLPWTELDLPTALWTIEGARSKNKQKDLTQLSPQSLAILAARPKFKDCPYVLTNDGMRPVGGWSDLKEDLDKAILERRKKAAIAAGDDPATVQPMPHWVLHDLRRTAASNLAAMGFSETIIDRVLHHSKKRKGVIKVYNRYEYFVERRDALLRWGARVEALTTPAPTQQAAE